VSEEVRRAPAAFALADAAGATSQQGQGEAVIGDDGVSVGPVTVAFLDADAMRAADYCIELDVWPSGRLVLSQLGRRFDTFAAELRRSRNQARVAGVLAHGIAMPDVFSGALFDGRTARAADFQVYDTHVTIVPEDADPFQIPLGALTGVAVSDDPPSVVLDGGVQRTIAGQLARKRDAFHAAVLKRREAQGRLLSDLTGNPGFADGLAAPRSRVAGFDALLERVTARDRVECAAALLAGAKGGEPRLGFVQLLDPDAESLQPASALPENWASFLLVTAGPLVALEILAGPSAATYVFEGEVSAIGRDLQALHLRRGPLALTAKEAELTPSNPYRLALRRLEPLKRLRTATRARVIHNEAWGETLRAALVGVSPLASGRR
jgi:hypothetical protein